jgi:hypothetical protein
VRLTIHLHKAPRDFISMPPIGFHNVIMSNLRDNFVFNFKGKIFQIEFHKTPQDGITSDSCYVVIVGSCKDKKK